MDKKQLEAVETVENNTVSETQVTGTPVNNTNVDSKLIFRTYTPKDYQKGEVTISKFNNLAVRVAEDFVKCSGNLGAGHTLKPFDNESGAELTQAYSVSLQSACKSVTNYYRDKQIDIQNPYNPKANIPLMVWAVILESTGRFAIGCEAGAKVSDKNLKLYFKASDHLYHELGTSRNHERADKRVQVLMQYLMPEFDNVELYKLLDMIEGICEKHDRVYTVQPPEDVIAFKDGVIEYSRTMIDGAIGLKDLNGDKFYLKRYTWKQVQDEHPDWFFTKYNVNRNYTIVDYDTWQNTPMPMVSYQVAVLDSDGNEVLDANGNTVFEQHTWNIMEYFENMFTDQFPHQADSIKELIATIFRPRRNWGVLAYFMDGTAGQGSNGKSTLLEFMGRLVGDDNYADVKLGDNGGFAWADMPGASLIAATECTDKITKDDMNVMKAIATRDRVSLNRKQKSFFNGTVQATVVLAFNKVLQFPDKTGSRKRRERIYNFDKRYDADTANPDVRTRFLTDKASIEWFLGYIVYAVGMLSKGMTRFGFEDTTQSIMESLNDPICQFLQIIEDDEYFGNIDVITYEDLYQLYKMWYMKEYNCSADEVMKNWKMTNFIEAIQGSIKNESNWEAVGKTEERVYIKKNQGFDIAMSKFFREYETEFYRLCEYKNGVNVIREKMSKELCSKYLSDEGKKIIEEFAGYGYKNEFRHVTLFTNWTKFKNGIRSGFLRRKKPLSRSDKAKSYIDACYRLLKDKVDDEVRNVALKHMEFMAINDNKSVMWINDDAKLPCEEL